MMDLWASDPMFRVLGVLIIVTAVFFCTFGIIWCGPPNDLRPAMVRLTIMGAGLVALVTWLFVETERVYVVCVLVAMMGLAAECVLPQYKKLKI